MRAGAARKLTSNLLKRTMITGEQLVVPLEQARILYRVSFLTLGTFILAAYLRIYEGMVVTGLVFVCSINYWRRPTYSWRRTMDICNTMSCLVYQTWRSTFAPTMTAYLALTYFGVACYLIGSSRMGDWTKWHVCVHVFGNAGNVALYSGLRTLSLREDPKS